MTLANYLAAKTTPDDIHKQIVYFYCDGAEGAVLASELRRIYPDWTRLIGHLSQGAWYWEPSGTQTANHLERSVVWMVCDCS